MYGFIPDKIKIIKSPAYKTEEIKYGDKTIVATHAFIADSANKKNIETGLRWASRDNYQYDPVKQQYIKLPSESPIEVECGTFTVPYLFLYAEDSRTGGHFKGGHVWKAVFPLDREKEDDFVAIDLRDDVLLDCIQNAKIDKGWIISDFIFARVGSNMKVLRVGSKEYIEMVKQTQFKKQSKLTNNDLVYGGLYKSKVETLIYCGRVNKWNVKSTYNSMYSYYSGGLRTLQEWYLLDDPEQEYQKSGYIKRDPSPESILRYEKYKRDFILEPTYLSNVMWFIDKPYKKGKEEFTSIFFSAKFTKSHSLKDKIGDYEIPEQSEFINLFNTSAKADCIKGKVIQMVVKATKQYASDQHICGAGAQREHYFNYMINYLCDVSVTPSHIQTHLDTLGVWKYSEHVFSTKVLEIDELMKYLTIESEKI